MERSIGVGALSVTIHEGPAYAPLMFLLEQGETRVTVSELGLSHSRQPQSCHGVPAFCRCTASGTGGRQGGEVQILVIFEIEAVFDSLRASERLT